MKGYTTVEDVASQLGRTLTDEQSAYVVASVLPAVEDWIDLNGGHAYGSTVVIAEPMVMVGQYTWLAHTPVTSIQEIRGYYYGQDANSLLPVAADRWVLLDPSIGYVRIPAARLYAHLEADYTPNATIPARIKLAASIVAGVFMRTALHPETEWLTDYASAQDVRLKFRALEIPPHVYTLLDSSSGTGNFVVA